jgi:peptide/nickel transport system substrate-binding protein
MHPKGWTMRRATAWLTPIALMAACAADAPVSDTLGSLTIGVAAPVIRQSATPLGLAHHRDALTRETLVTLAADGRPLPRVLESWQASADGLTWRLKIRPGIRFHDSTPVVAKALIPQMHIQLMSSRLGKIASIEPEGDEIIVVRLRERFGFLPEDLGQATAVRTVQQTGGDGKVTEKAIGTGPYVVVEDFTERATLQEFPNHYRGDPGVARIEVKLFPDQRNAWSALMRDEIDVLYEVSRESLDFVRSESSINVVSFLRPYVYLLGFNSKKPGLTRPDVRRALSQAIDRNAFVQQALLGEGEVATGHVWPRHWAYDANVRPPAHDLAEVRRLLEAAGLPLRTVPGRMPARLRLRCLVYEPFRQMALVVQRQLAEVDVDLQLEELSLQDYLVRMSSGDYDTFIFEMTSGRTLMWPYLFWHSSSPMLKHGYSGSDDILDRMRMSANDDETRAAVHALQRRMIDDPPAAFLAWSRVSRAVTRRFLLPTTGDDIYQTIAKWKPAARTGASQ